MKPGSLLAPVVLAGCGGGGGSVALGPHPGLNGDLQGRQIFLPSSPWNTPVDAAEVDPDSDAIFAHGANDEPAS